MIMLAVAFIIFLFMLGVSAKRINNHKFTQLPDDSTPGASYYGEMKFTDGDLNRKYWKARGLYAKEQLFDLQEGEAVEYSQPDENKSDDDYNDDHDVYSNHSSQTELTEDDTVESGLLVWLSDIVTDILFGESYSESFDQYYYYEPKTYLRGYYNPPSPVAATTTGLSNTITLPNTTLPKTDAATDAAALSPAGGSDVSDTGAPGADTYTTTATARTDTAKPFLDNVYEMDDDSGYDGFLDQETKYVDDTEDDDPNYTYYPSGYHTADQTEAETVTGVEADKVGEDLSSADGTKGYWYYDVAYFVKQWSTLETNAQE